MTKKPYGPKFEKEQKKRRVLERKVLQHLKENGPRPYDAIYVLFDLHRTAEIQPVLHELHQWKYIEISKDTDQTTSITESGLQRLESRED